MTRVECCAGSRLLTMALLTGILAAGVGVSVALGWITDPSLAWISWGLGSASITFAVAEWAHRRELSWATGRMLLLGVAAIAVEPLIAAAAGVLAVVAVIALIGAALDWT